MGWKTITLFQLLSLLVSLSFAVDPNCDYHQIMEGYKQYYLYNREYPNNYGPNQICRWIAVAPEGYKINLYCTIEIPQSSGCTMDRVLISLTGNANLEDARTYCGYHNLVLESQSNVSIGLITASNTPGGRFDCMITTIINPRCDCGWKLEPPTPLYIQLEKYKSPVLTTETETGINEYPMMAGLINFLTRDLFCGATIISLRYGLSAARCVKGKEANNTGFLVGEHNISTNSETDATQLLQVSYFKMHELYNSNDPRGEYDLAIVRTATDIIFSIKVGPACLPFKYVNDLFAGDTVDILGWGTTEFTGPKSDVLLETNANVLSVSDCNASVGGTVNQMCTNTSGHDACQSDSGGPLLWMDVSSFRLQLVGVISSGYECASNKPALNTRITAFLDWIRTNTPDAQYCIK